MINGIVCCAKDFGIGKIDRNTGKGQLLFNLPQDLAYFKFKTTGSIVVMGYSTYLSLPKRPLKNRVNIVLWDKATSIDCLEGCLTFNNFEQLLHIVQILAKQYEVFICGGASIYKLFLPYYDRVYITRVDTVDPEATAFFPNLADCDWLECTEGSAPIEDNGYQIQFLTYTRKPVD